MTEKSKTVDRFGTFNHVTDNVVREKELGVADYGLWAYFFRHGDLKGYVVLSNSKIMKDLNIKDERTLRKHIKNLMNAGLIGIEQKGMKNRTPTKYWYQRKPGRLPG